MKQDQNLENLEREQLLKEVYSNYEAISNC